MSRSHHFLCCCPAVLLCRFGEVVDCHLVRDKETGKSRGFAFVAFEDQRSCVLAIDNLNGASVVNRTLRVDHADKYRRPKESTPTPSSQSDEFQFDGEAAPDYDERRKAIWDYNAYGPPTRPQGQAGDAEGGGVRVSVREGVSGGNAAPTSYSVDVKRLQVGENSEDKNALRILTLWEERQTRKKQREEEERRREEQQRNGRGVRGGGHTFGDQTILPMQSREAKEEERKDGLRMDVVAAVKEEDKRDLRGGRRGESKGGERDGGADAEDRHRRSRRRQDSRDRSPRRRSDSRERQGEHRHRHRDRDRDSATDKRRHRSRDPDSRRR